MPRSGASSYVVASMTLLIPLLYAGEPDYEEVAAEAMAKGNLARVKDICKRWAQSKPKNHRPHVLLGRSYLRAGFLGHAKEHFETARTLSPLSPEPACGLGDVFLAYQRPDDAVREYRAALESAVDLAPALTGLARAYLLRREFASAEVHAGEALDFDDTYTPAVCVMGDVCREQGRFQEALAHFERALRLDPECADAAHGMGMTLEVAGNTAGAQRAWRRFLQLEPESPRARAVRDGLVVVRRRLLCHSAQRPAPSPDGKRFAYMGVGEENGFRLFVSTIANPQDARPITPRWPAGPNGLPDASQDPDWSPDGRQILFLRHRENTNNALYVASPAGDGEPKRLLDSVPITGGGRWSPDGSRILLTVLKPTIGPWLADSNGANCRPVPGSETWKAAHCGSDWCPDGRHIICTVRRSDKAQESDLFRCSIETGEETRITAAGHAHWWPVFTRVSPDGSQVAYARNLQGVSWRSRKRAWSVCVALTRAPGRDVPIVPVTHFWPISQWMPDGRGLLAITNPNRVTLLEFGGLDRRPIGLRATRTPRGLDIALGNRTQAVQTVRLTYELFDPDSIRVACGQIGPTTIEIQPETVASYGFQVETARRGMHTVKILSVTDADERTIRLADYQVR